MAYAQAPSERVTLQDITAPLVPMQHTRGDREFDGNGPDITARVTLQPTDNGFGLNAIVYFRASETKHDWSTVEETFTVPVWAGNGRRIRSVTPAVSEVSFRSAPGGPQFGFPAEDWAALFRVVEDVVRFSTPGLGLPGAPPTGAPPSQLPCADWAQCASTFRSGALKLSQDNHIHILPPRNGGPVAAFMIVGDTGGPDISDDRNPKDDTRIVGIKFAPVQVAFEGGGGQRVAITPPPSRVCARIGGAYNSGGSERITLNRDGQTISGAIANGTRPGFTGRCVDGTVTVSFPDDPSCCTGVFDGTVIRWSNNTSWTKTESLNRRLLNNAIGAQDASKF